MLKILLLVTATFAFEASACQCRRASVEDGMLAADLVFGAEVVGAKVDGENVRIDVRRVANLKGDASHIRKLLTGASRAACGITISVPGRYIFFTKKNGEVDSCSATRSFEDSGIDDLKMKVVRLWDQAERAKR